MFRDCVVDFGVGVAFVIRRRKRQLVRMTFMNSLSLMFTSNCPLGLVGEMLKHPRNMVEMYPCGKRFEWYVNCPHLKRFWFIALQRPAASHDVVSRARGAEK